jgi:hypothetical protein
MPGEGSSGNTLAGEVRVYFGGPDGIGATPSQQLRGASARELFGYSVFGVGDVNGDGFADVAVSVIGPSLRIPREATRIEVFLGGPSGLQTPAHRVLVDGDLTTLLGVFYGGRGDYNGDGFTDIAAIAPGSDEGAMMRTPNRLDVFLGGRDGLSATRAWTRSGTAGRNGPTAAQAADANGDGFDDLLVLDSSVEVTAGTRGALLLFLSTATGPATTASVTLGPSMGVPFAPALGIVGRRSLEGVADFAVATSTPGARALSVFRVESGGIRATPVTSRSVTRAQSVYGASVASW